MLFLFHQYQCFIPFELFHLGLEFGEFPFYADFHLFDIWKFGQGVHGHGEEEGFVGFAFEVVQFFGEVHRAGAVFQVDVFQANSGGEYRVLAASIGFEHFRDGGLGGAVTGFDFDVHWQDVQAVFAGFVVSKGGFFFGWNRGR